MQRVWCADPLDFRFTLLLSAVEKQNFIVVLRVQKFYPYLCCPDAPM